MKMPQARVYIFSVQSDLVKGGLLSKIGQSQSPYHRRSGLFGDVRDLLGIDSSDLWMTPLDLVIASNKLPRRKAWLTEQALCKMFSDKRVISEWFVLTSAEIVRACDHIESRYGRASEEQLRKDTFSGRNPRYSYQWWMNTNQF